MGSLNELRLHTEALLLLLVFSETLEVLEVLGLLIYYIFNLFCPLG